MARHLRASDPRTRWIRGSTLAAIWTGGLVVGSFGVLSVAARYGCARSAHGLACRRSGSALGLLVVLGVVAVVTAVTVSTHDRRLRTVLVAAALGAAGLLACYLAAHALLATA